LSQYSKNTGSLLHINRDIYEVVMPDYTTLQSGDFALQVAMGKVPGVTGLSISGYNSAVGTTFVPAWENGEYVYFPSAQKVLVWSDSASDTNVSIRIVGLDANYAQIVETVVLTNGTVGVSTVNNFLRINSLNITQTPENVGKIRAGSLDKVITLAYIGSPTDASFGRSQMTVYTVPAGFTFFLTQSNWYTNQTGSQTALYRSWTKTNTGVINIILTFPFVSTYNSLKVVPRPYFEKTDIQWQVSSTTGTSRIGGQIEGYLISNAYL
jgi:hypothetical protein